ncbi:hypothetical protein MP228_013068 [Amoeboaphelidium protococcarum]|nr:hypothetical protein MP228_013068 [Amoeboaphelidium protococcarum]
MRVDIWITGRLQILRDQKRISVWQKKKVKEKYRQVKFGDSQLAAFKKCHDIRQLRVHGERALLPDDWEKQLQPLISDIGQSCLKPKNVHNWDETGLFVRQQQKYTLAKRSDDGVGAKQDKTRVIVRFCWDTNADGSFQKGGAHWQIQKTIKGKQ